MVRSKIKPYVGKISKNFDLDFTKIETPCFYEILGNSFFHDLIISYGKFPDKGPEFLSIKQHQTLVSKIIQGEGETFCEVHLGNKKGKLVSDYPLGRADENVLKVVKNLSLKEAIDRYVSPILDGEESANYHHN